MIEDVLFDASRLLSRTERSAPTGVDRERVSVTVFC